MSSNGILWLLISDDFSDPHGKNSRHFVEDLERLKRIQNLYLSSFI